MADFREVAKQYIDNGLWVIPVKATKSPAISNWFELQTRPMNDREIEKGFKKCHGIALLCGGIPQIELIDYDLKYDLSGDLYDRVKAQIPNELKKKLFVQSTRNLGFHWIYKAPKECMHPNQKLANRYTTPYERHQNYLNLFQVPSTRDSAMKMAINDSHRVLIETRSGTAERCGGYGLISPTEGYNVVYKPEGGLQKITAEEHELLLSTIRSYNEVMELDVSKHKNYDNTEWKLSPFDDFNERGDALDLLYECGWENVGKYRNSVRLRRPGATSDSSGLFDVDTGILNVFSTSTRFDTNKGYNQSGVFIELECNGDGSLAYSKLISQGFGIKK